MTAKAIVSQIRSMGFKIHVRNGIVRVHLRSLNTRTESLSDALQWARETFRMHSRPVTPGVIFPR